MTVITQLSIPKINSGTYGNLIELDDGVYDHVSREGLTKTQIVFRAKNKGKAIIKGAPIDTVGAEIEQSGFQLQYSSTEQSVLNLRGSKYRFLDNICRFGNPTSSRNDWIYIKADDGLIQGNDIGNKVGMGNIILLGASNVLGKNTKILNNKIHDFTGGSGNGAEMIRFGASSVAKEDFNIEFANNEIYNHSTSDPELITVKSSNNYIHDNIIRNNKSAITFRHGRNNKFINNKLEGTGLRMYGKGHVVTKNNFKRNSNSQLLQIVIGNGEFAEEELNTTASYTQVRDLTFQNNYIDAQDSTDQIIFCFGYGSHVLKPINNTIIENTILASKGTLASTRDGASWANNIVNNNIFWTTGTAKLGNMPNTGYVIKDPNLVTPPTPLPPVSNPLDKFGVRKLYPTKTAGEEWFMNVANILNDPRVLPSSNLKATGVIKMNTDGSFKVVTAGDVDNRLNILTSGGYDHAKCVLDWNLLKQRGYMQNTQDWRNVEITAYVRINKVYSTSGTSLVWYARGGHHSTSYTCEGSAYKGNIKFDGQTRFQKEMGHGTNTYFTTPNTATPLTGKIIGKWFGYKFCCYDLVNGDVKLENWLDLNLDNNWIKILEKIDNGGWGTNPYKCGGAVDQRFVWGGPQSVFRFDATNDIDFAKMSVREIQP